MSLIERDILFSLMSCIDLDFVLVLSIESLHALKILGFFLFSMADPLVYLDQAEVQVKVSPSLHCYTL